MSFESNVHRLEEIVAELAEEELPLERALRLFEEGVERLREAAGELAVAEAQVKLLREKTDGTFALDEFGA
jgi:exodeoxyribonuclease VII small subunit